MFLQKLNNLFLIILFCVSANLFADTHWEVAAIFLGKNEDSLFQNDIKAKLLEIKNITKSNDLTITSLVESNQSNYKEFFQNAFKSSESKKLLLIYSHGLGPLGLKNYSVDELKKTILDFAPKLDLLWFDACFMANLEFLFNIRKYSTFSIASEDAEFSSGLSLENLEILKNYSDPKAAANALAADYINSYSYQKQGKLKENSIISSATISVIENSKLDLFTEKIAKIKKIFDELDEKLQFSIINKSVNKYSMDNEELIDLGHFLIETRAKTDNLLDDKILTDAIRSLNITSVRKIKSNPRYKLRAPIYKESILVWGFDNFKRGSENDYINNSELFRQILKPDGFIKGPNNTKWPYKKMPNGKKLNLTPFAPGLNEFNYYFAELDGRKLPKTEKTILRSVDVFETAQNNNGPLVYSAYTQEIGVEAERYTGINISAPNSIPSIDYFESEFNQITNWLSL